MAIGGFYCSTIDGSGLTDAGRVAIFVVSAIGLVGALNALKAEGPGAPLRDNILLFWRDLIDAQLGWRAFRQMALLVIATAAMALVMNAQTSGKLVGAAGGLQHATFVLVFVYAWRLRVRWRLTAFVLWAAVDIMVVAFSQSVPHGEPSGGARLIASVLAAWALLTAFDVSTRGPLSPRDA